MLDHALSPLDGRYASSVDSLRSYFSEEALMHARVEVEISYFIALAELPDVRELRLNAQQKKALRGVVERFSDRDIIEIKKIESRTRHDVKAVEYYLQERFSKIAGLKDKTAFIHFALTSEDVNNLAYGILIHRALEDVIRPGVKTITNAITRVARSWSKVSLLSLTHGQPATPTTVGKEFQVFAERLQRQSDQLKRFRMQGKLGGAVGTFSAHAAAYPDTDWPKFGARFIRSLGLIPLSATTQINPHDDIAELSHLLCRINTILLDFSRDSWLYISRGVFKQKVVTGEVGSSTMPHKVNPIDFENAEGNLGVSTALFMHFAEKLPVSRLQRDLSDSTVQRNIGVAFGYHMLALHSLARGLGKLSLDRSAVRRELEAHPEVIAEAIQTVLRKHGAADAYEKLKKLTRGETVTKEILWDYIEALPIPRGERERLLKML
ncbi:adenylosuccinate lyase [Candidatus Peribacteria bacterium RIFCSPLOWO2_01_FULL_53_10]|nr:MAG: adenylosuccinate lyase [Candidatus Peribacteria bacterium RIFCSPLOWO2_01_FULL_53_10]